MSVTNSNNIEGPILKKYRTTSSNTGTFRPQCRIYLGLQGRCCYLGLKILINNCLMYRSGQVGKLQLLFVVV